MDLTERQLRRIIKEELLREQPSRQWGSYANKQAQGAGYSDVIVMSPNGDSVLVDGQETYPQDVPAQLEYAAGARGSFEDFTANELIATIEDQMRSGYIELSVELDKDGEWSWE